MCVLVAQSCLSLCDSMDCSPPGSSVRGILQARILEWVAILFSRDLPNPGIEPRSSGLQTGSLLSEPLGKPLRGMSLEREGIGTSAKKSSRCQKQTPLFHKVSKSMNEKKEEKITQT